MNVVILAAEQAELIAFEIVPFITTLVVFLIVLAIAAKIIWPPIMKGLDERDRKIREEIKAAEEAREQAKRVLGDYEKSLAQAREEANQMVVKAKQDAKVLAEELRSRNEQELTAMKERATREIEAAKRTAISELYREAASLASGIAGKILEREINEDDQRRFVEQSMRELETAAVTEN